MIFDEISDVMNQQSARKMSIQTGLSPSKIYRLSQGTPFYLDHNMIFALRKLGYEIRLEEIHNQKK